MYNYIEVLEEALQLNREALERAFKAGKTEQQKNILLSMSLLKDSLIEVYKDKQIYDRRKK